MAIIFRLKRGNAQTECMSSFFNDFYERKTQLLQLKLYHEKIVQTDFNFQLCYNLQIKLLKTNLYFKV